MACHTLTPRRFIRPRVRLEPKTVQKKHASDLSPYPAELIPFEPLDSADSRYGQLHKPLCESPFKEAGIHGFTPPTPFKVASRQNVLDG
jgi:hypothetical protein